MRPTYESVEWVYVYRDFSGKGLDRTAERISLRFGVTSWPQLFLVDPATLAIIRHTGRSERSFLAAAAYAGGKVERSPPAEAESLLEAMREAGRRADVLERRPSTRLAVLAIKDEDIVVRTLALRTLVKSSPRSVAANAVDLLATPSDPFRYEVCQVLAKLGDPRAMRPLHSLVENPRDSLNPNVLRIRAVEALGACGDRRSVDVIEPFAASGDYRNGLTRVSIAALAKIAQRDRAARRSVARVLKSAYPPLPSSSAGDRERDLRGCVSLARAVHEALGSEKPFPEPYDEKAREALMR